MAAGTARQQPETEAPRAALHRPALAAITLLGAALRLLWLGRDGLWTDEATTLVYARLGLRALFVEIGNDLQAPLYYLSLELPLTLFGETEWAVRSLSALAGIAAIPLVAEAGRRLLGPRAGLIAALLLAVNPLHVHYSREARVQVVLALAVVVAFLAADALARRPGAARLAGAAAAFLALPLLHPTAALHAPAVLVAAALGRGRRGLLALTAAAALALLVFSPWFLVAGRQGGNAREAYSWARPGYEARAPWLVPLSLAAVSSGSPAPVRNETRSFPAAAWASLALAGGLGLLAWSQRRRLRDERAPARLALVTLVPLAGLHAASELWVPVHVVGRVDAPAAPFLALLAAGGAALLRPRLQLVAVLTLVGLAAAPVAVELLRDTRSQERNISAFLARELAPGDVFVVTGPFLHAYEYYLGRFGPEPRLLVYPLQREEHPSWLDSSLMDEPTLRREAEILAERAFEGARRDGGAAVWLLRAPASHADFVARALASRAATVESRDPRYLGLRIERHALPAR